MSDWFHNINGYASVKKRLERLVETKRIPHALLIFGPEEAPLKQFAHAFAQMILRTERNQHPDIHFYYPEGKAGLHSIETMRRFNDDVFLAPFEAQKKIFVIMEADRMLPTSANALLKTLEEPASGSVIILVSSRPSSMISTLFSRCQKIQLDLSEELNEERDSLLQLLLNALASGVMSSYSSILQIVDQVAGHLDEEAKELENSLSEELLSDFNDQLSAARKDSLRKEIDGAVALRKKTRIKQLFIGILAWYRDLYLIKANGNGKLLMNPDFKEQLYEHAKAKKLPPLASVDSAIRDILTALERSTSPKICFENLFLRLMEYHSK